MASTFLPRFFNVSATCFETCLVRVCYVFWNVSCTFLVHVSSTFLPRVFHVSSTCLCTCLLRSSTYVKMFLWFLSVSSTFLFYVSLCVSSSVSLWVSSYVFFLFFLRFFHVSSTFLSRVFHVSFACIWSFLYVSCKFLQCFLVRFFYVSCRFLFRFSYVSSTFHIHVSPKFLQRFFPAPLTFFSLSRCFHCS